MTPITSALEHADGYSDAFYAIGKLLDIPAQSKSPREVWATQMLPEIRRLLALTRRAEAAEWQGISTAPRDRTTFDVWVPDEDGGYRVTDLYFSARGLLMKGGAPAELPRWPTHWRPLPRTTFRSSHPDRGGTVMDDASLAVFLNLTDEEASIIIPSLTPQKRAVFERMADVVADLNMGVVPKDVIVCRPECGGKHI